MKVVRVAPPGYNALTDTDPRHFSLMSDQDNVLIKEHSRGSESILYENSLTLNHAFGYVPHAFVYAEQSDGRYKICNGYDVYAPWQTWVTKNNLVAVNSSGSTGIVKYFLFYDDIKT
jgi:hypothetical protein